MCLCVYVGVIGGVIEHNVYVHVCVCVFCLCVHVCVCTRERV